MIAPKAILENIPASQELQMSSTAKFLVVEQPKPAAPIQTLP